MGSAIPKQFLCIDGRPILMHTIERFHQYDPSMQIVVVLPRDQFPYWKQLCQAHHFNADYCLTAGGETRFHSVSNGLAAVDAQAQCIGVHDGVRPYVSVDVIRNTYDSALQTGAAIPVIDIVETVRHLLPGGTSETVPRSEYKLVQTPQVFRANLLRSAYQQPYNPGFTDDASVVEAYGHPITLVCGNRENIKITTPADL